MKANNLVQVRSFIKCGGTKVRYVSTPHVHHAAATDQPVRRIVRRTALVKQAA